MQGSIILANLGTEKDTLFSCLKILTNSFHLEIIIKSRCRILYVCTMHMNGHMMDTLIISGI